MTALTIASTSQPTAAYPAIAASSAHRRAREVRGPGGAAMLPRVRLDR
jgi:hypothetical protein